MPIETFAYDTSEHLLTERDIAHYTEAVLDDGDQTAMRQAIGIVARACGMTQISEGTGIARETLYRALSGDDADAVVHVLKALAARVSLQPAAE